MIRVRRAGTNGRAAGPILQAVKMSGRVRDSGGWWYPAGSWVVMGNGGGVFSQAELFAQFEIVDAVDSGVFRRGQHGANLEQSDRAGR